ncbi:MAG TPA: TIGR03986 family CRISPR-associated RAMP protein [Verrucomicrobiota bacterium]|nr:TIGR03986 family CRISPR-associated RAMP protein [Verrucomicrobiota bacterium]
MPDLTSAYNFVPLNERVFFPNPEGAPAPSQDIPYSDGLCGTIGLEIRATTPLYIRAAGSFDKEARKKAGEALGQKYDELRNNDNSNATWQHALDAMTGTHANLLCAYTDFYHLPGHSYALPWSEIKGMLRTVVEIASWGKLQGVPDEKMSFRDLRNPSLYGERFVCGDPHIGIGSTTKAGWIEINGDKWVLTPCEYARIDITTLASYANRAVDFTQEQSACSKYKAWQSCRLSLQVDFQPDANTGPHRHDRQIRKAGQLVIDPVTKKPKVRKLRLYYRKALSLGAGVPGTLVFTGQPSKWSPGKRGNKHMDFIFYQEKPDQKKTLSAELRKDFESAHQLAPGEEQKDWAWGFWRQKLNNGERMPVFYLESGGQIKAFGLAQLFRINYAHTLAGRLPLDHKSPRPDLAELIFGPFTGGEMAWRGRVWGQPFVAKENPQRDLLCVSVLGTPRASFYPNYLEQPNQGNPYKTLDDSNSELRGWKRYPVPKDGTELVPNPPMRDDQGRHKMAAATYFRPLHFGTRFTGEISFHNLRPWELGALLWAIGFGVNSAAQPSSKFRHSLGMAKPLGCGAVHLTVTGLEARNTKGISQQEVENTALTAFRNLLAASCAGGNWETSDRIKELLLMADESKQPRDSRLLRHPCEVKYFAEFKKQRHFLRPFSKLPGVQP